MERRGVKWRAICVRKRAAATPRTVNDEAGGEERGETSSPPGDSVRHHVDGIYNLFLKGRVEILFYAYVKDVPVNV